MVQQASKHVSGGVNIYGRKPSVSHQLVAMGIWSKLDEVLVMQRVLS